MEEELNINKQIVKIIHKYIPVEGWKEAFIEELNRNGFRIVHSPTDLPMVLK